MIFKYTFAFLFVTISFSAQHQFLKKPDLDVEDVKNLKPKDGSDSPAEVLYRSMHHKIDKNGMIARRYFERVKIYNKAQAEDFLNKEIYVWSGLDMPKQNLSNLKAVTYNYENGKVQTTKTERDSKFQSRENKDAVVTKFAFSSVKDGSVLEYEYLLESPSDYLVSMPKFVIEDSVPIRYVEYVFDSPAELQYNLAYIGELIPKHKESGIKTMYGSNYDVFRFAYENVPAFKKEKFVLNADNYKTSIKNELNATSFNNVYKSYATNWQDIKKRLLENDNFGLQLRREGLVKGLLPANIKSVTPELEKADQILKFVQANYTWDKNDGIFTEKGVRNLIATKTGNIAEINMLLTMLLRSEGIKANPVILTTIDKGFLLSHSPSIVTPNYLITLAEISGKKIMMDAASKHAEINMVMPRALNYKGVLIEEKDAQVVDVVYPDVSKTFLTVDAKMNTDATFTGKFSDRDTKLYSLMANEAYNRNKDDYTKTYRDKYKFTLNNIKSAQVDHGDFETSMDFSSDSFVDNIGNKLVFNPLLFLYTKDHDFNQKEARKSPLEFLSKNEKIKKVTITLPEGYVFENVPASKKMRTDDNALSYVYNVTKVSDNQLVLETKIEIADSYYPREYFPAFKQIFDNVTKLEGQMVTVVKKN